MISLTRGFGLLFLALALAGCATRSACGPAPYQEARATPPLAVPEGMDRPDQRAALRVPEPRAAGGRLANDPENCIIDPPPFYVEAGAPNPEGLPVRPSSAATGAAPTVAPAATRLTREVTAFLNEWTAAWNQRDADSWLRFYAADYAPAGYADPEEWRQEQRSRFEIPASTRIDANSVAVEPRPDGNARVRFIQHFGEAPEQRSVVKELVLEPRSRERTDWRILEERIVEVL